MSTVTASATHTAEGELSHRQILTILTGLMMGMFLAALDQNIVATAIRTIADDLNGLSVQAWVTTSYLITSTIATPLYGKLSDIYGRKPFFMAAISIFVVGSALCTLSTSMYMLAGFRALQGVGAGGLFSMALAIIGDIVPPRERAKYQGYFLAVFATSSVLGPVIGGFFAGSESILGIAGWRWVFLVNVPIGIVALIVVTRTLHIHHLRREHRIDWWGASVLIVALVPLLTVAEQGRDWGWASGRSLSAFAIGAIGVVLFIVAEYRMGEEALIPLRIFKNRAILVTIVGSVVVGAGMFGGISVLPQYLQIVHDATPTVSGFMMLPLVLGIMMSSVASGQLIARTGKIRTFPIIGAGLMVVGLLLLSTIGADTPLWTVMTFMLVFGLGLGNTMQPMTLIIQNAVSPREIGMATSSATFFRQIGATLGVAVFLSILFSTVGGKIQSAFRAAALTPEFQQAVTDPKVLSDPVNRTFIEGLSSAQNGGASPLSGLLNDSSVIQELDHALAHPIQVGFSDAMDSVFLTGAFVVAIGFIVLMFLPKIELRTQSGRVAAAAEAADAAAAEHDALARGGTGQPAVAGTPDVDTSTGRIGPAAVAAVRPDLRSTAVLTRPAYAATPGDDHRDPSATSTPAAAVRAEAEGQRTDGADDHHGRAAGAWIGGGDGRKGRHAAPGGPTTPPEHANTGGRHAARKHAPGG
jgi:EmrB/QacA subfamily drug resistance transporter